MDLSVPLSILSSPEETISIRFYQLAQSSKSQMIDRSSLPMHHSAPNLFPDHSVDTPELLLVSSYPY